MTELAIFPAQALVELGLFGGQLDGLLIFLYGVGMILSLRIDGGVETVQAPRGWIKLEEGCVALPGRGHVRLDTIIEDVLVGRRKLRGAIEGFDSRLRMGRVQL